MKSVYLSPSAQENNIGIGSYGTEEYRMNQVCDVVEKELKRHGVITFRNKTNMSIKQIVQDSNACNPTIHFAMHSNAGGGKGCEIFCNKFGGHGEKLAKAVYSKIAPLTPTSDRGIKQGHNFYGENKHIYELAYTEAPAALIEIAYHDNKDDAVWIVANIEIIGIAIAKGILEYLEIKYIAIVKVENVKKNILYRVIAGSFSEKENAENRVKELKKLGIEAYIKLFEVK
jgi:N-acetylmuramoyl-L-alanine amidase